MKKISKVYIAAGVVAIVAVVAWAMSGGKKQEEVSFDTAKVAPANLMTSVTATGTIEPVTSVTVGTQVSGIVSKLYVDYNSVVKKGQVIAELDKTNLVSQLNASKATLASAQSKLNYESANFKRYATLYKKGLVSADEYENAQLTYKQAKDQWPQLRKMCSAHRQTSAMQPSHRPSTVWCCQSRWRRVRPWLPASLRQNCSPLRRTLRRCR